MKPFLEQLEAKALLGDGAMGTLLYSRNVPVRQCLEALVIEEPASIAAIHKAYARAGAAVITTHTFGANRMRLAIHGLEERVGDFNRAAVRLAQDARVSTGCDFLIAGNVGPVGKAVAWEDGDEAARVATTFREQISTLAESGVDLLLFETFSDVKELVVAVREARKLCALPVVASVSYGADGLTLAGQGITQVVKRLVAAGVDVIGANCSVGPAQMVETLRLMRAAAPDALLSVSPNAGLPVRDEAGQLHYRIGAAEFASFVPVFLAQGARWIGGCCGTTPEHIEAMRRVI